MADQIKCACGAEYTTQQELKDHASKEHVKK